MLEKKNKVGQYVPKGIKNNQTLFCFFYPKTDPINGYLTSYLEYENIESLKTDLLLLGVLTPPKFNKSGALVRTVDNKNKRYIYDSILGINYFDFDELMYIPWPVDGIISLNYDDLTDNIYAIISGAASAFEIVALNIEDRTTIKIKEFNDPKVVVRTSTAWISKTKSFLFGVIKNKQYYLAAHNLISNDTTYTKTHEPLIDTWQYDSKSESIFGITTESNKENLGSSYFLVNVDIKDGSTINKYLLKEISSLKIFDSAIDVRDRRFILSVKGRAEEQDLERIYIFSLISGKMLKYEDVASLYSGIASGLEVIDWYQY